MKKTLYGSGIFIILLACILLVLWIIKQCDGISCISTDQLLLRPHPTVYEHTKNTYRALYMSDFGFFRVEKQTGLSQMEADTLSKTTTMQLEGLFNVARSPYPGPLSDKITCDPLYQPNVSTYNTPLTTMTIIKSYVNDQLQYGTCIENQIAYVAHIALIFCKNRSSWYKAELFIPKTKNEDAIYITNQLDSLNSPHTTLIKLIHCR
ncbi:MAG: hypothetical protein UT26_C0010G0011 [Microgenomates group bacterium GW2011_GWC1_39_12]|nr:MAG: hypothetical protein UT26_C0010G0011 [Microgenomates group bacterium GW2011_GWC1_39_12]